MIEKLIKTNDQPSSLALQQKLQYGTQEVKNLVMQAIAPHTIQLARNRFGNFLIQRCMEHGSELQITSLATCLKGNIRTLSQDRFACHVIQKVNKN